MDLKQLREKVASWDSKNLSGSATAEAEYTTILFEIEHYATKYWDRYTPTSQSSKFNPSYMARLAKWIGNVDTEEEQQLMLRYALEVSYFTETDFNAMYATAMQREVRPWIAKQIGAKLSNEGPLVFHELVDKYSKNNVWFIPVTESMNINSFCKVNNIVGHNAGPNFSLEMKRSKLEGNNDNVVYLKKLMRGDSSKSPLEYLVIMEDIVGSGTQAIDTIRWALEEFSNPILFIPLILCPNGAEVFRNLEVQYGRRFRIRPVLELSRDDLLGPERKDCQGWKIANKMESFAIDVTPKFTRDDPFGYKSTGCSIAKFSNTPDNTLPLVHHQSRSWNALFPRSTKGE